MLIDELIFWYACGWTAVAMEAIRTDHLRLGDIIIDFLGGPWAVLSEVVLFPRDNGPITVWRKP